MKADQSRVAQFIKQTSEGGAGGTRSLPPARGSCYPLCRLARCLAASQIPNTEPCHGLFARKDRNTTQQISSGP